MKKGKVIKKICSLVLVFLVVFGTGGATLAEDGTDQLISELHIEVSAPLCGQTVEGAASQTNAPRILLEEEQYAESAAPTAWVTYCDEEDPSSFIPFEGSIEGDRDYQALVTVKALPGGAFSDDLRVCVFHPDTLGYEVCQPLQQDREKIVFTVMCRSAHDWDLEQFTHRDSTCIEQGSNHYVCKADPSHTLTERLPVNPEAHAWSEWRVSREATRMDNGTAVRVCSLCGAVETSEIPSLTRPYSSVYEPITSWPMAATVAWRADESVLSAAGQDIRPATAFVWLDADLSVFDRNGNLLSNDINAYIDATAGTIIPAFYINDADTAAALKSWLQESGLLDCFVVSTPENRALVKDVADLLHVRGMLDFTMIKNPDNRAIANMIACVNDAHGKVVILSEEAASQETVRRMQSLTATVWAEAQGNTKSLMTLYTSGVNGVVTDDYEAAIRAEEWFMDDAPSLLRVPLIIGHRGDPSTYAENTLESALGAQEEGVDAVENDIQLSADGELFILHDETADRMLGIWSNEAAGSRIPAERFTLSELQSRTFRWSDIIQYNEVPASRSRWGILYGQNEQRAYKMPSLREYIETFRGTDMIHDTEIKSDNPAILPVFKELVDSYDAWDQFFTITMNKAILDAIYKDYPEISVGALGMRSTAEVLYKNYDAITAEKGAEAALKELYELLDQWNATYNPTYTDGFGETMVRAGRHRGLTVWPWTYVPDVHFAHDYLNGVTGMTLDYPWVATDYIVRILSEDVSGASTADIPKPVGVTQAGSERTLEDAEPVALEAISDTETLMMWRWRADLNVNGVYYGSYYLYSNPFVFTKNGAGSRQYVPYTDVSEEAYFGEAVHWAYEAGVTQGTDACTFSPDKVCTRAQVLTFLWRAMGEPEPASSEIPFVDVHEEDYYCKAVLWGIEQGITNGVDAEHFGSDKTCTRAQAVSFLWRARGGEDPEPSVLGFKDVPVTAYYSKAVHWAVDNKITGGTEELVFSPNESCSRAQIVTFLQRDAENSREPSFFEKLLKK